jgi:hypothetical protein
LLSDPRIAVFAACATLFHFANTAMLPPRGLLSQQAPENTAAPARDSANPGDHLPA